MSYLAINNFTGMDIDLHVHFRKGVVSMNRCGLLGHMPFHVSERKKSTA